MSFTPGPYQIIIGDDGCTYVCDVDGHALANVFEDDDAPLFQAAPDLYEALEFWATYEDDYTQQDDYGDWYCQNGCGARCRKNETLIHNDDCIGFQIARTRNALSKARGQRTTQVQ